MDPQDATFTYSLVESNACANIPTANGLESLTFDSNGTAWAEMDVSGGDGASDIALPVAIAALVFAVGVAVRHRRQV